MNLNDLKHFLNKQNYNNPEEEFLTDIYTRINSKLRSYFDYRFLQSRRWFSSKLKKYFYSYKKNLETRHKVRSYRLSELDPILQEDFRRQRQWGLDLIKTQNEENMLKLKRRFMDWVNLKTLKSKELPSLALPNNKHMKFILKDQTNKMNSSFDKAVSDFFGGAIAFQWKINNDNRVVGKPGGVNPKPSEMHGNHWKRRDKWYYNPSKKKFLKDSGILLSKFEGDYNTPEDGMPGVPIGCRCWAYYIYDIEDLPKDFRRKDGIDV